MAPMPPDPSLRSTTKWSIRTLLRPSSDVTPRVPDVAGSDDGSGTVRSRARSGWEGMRFRRPRSALRGVLTVTKVVPRGAVDEPPPRGLTRRGFLARLPPVRALLLVPVVVLVIVGLAPGCGSPPPGSPGSTKPGAACAEAADCGCWSCTCKGIGGAPGGAQLCIAGKCPTAQQACAPV